SAPVAAITAAAAAAPVAPARLARLVGAEVHEVFLGLLDPGAFLGADLGDEHALAAFLVLHGLLFLDDLLDALIGLHLRDGGVQRLGPLHLDLRLDESLFLDDDLLLRRQRPRRRELRSRLHRRRRGGRPGEAQVVIAQVVRRTAGARLHGRQQVVMLAGAT